MSFRIYMASDHHGVGIKSKIGDYVRSLGHQPEDLGSYDADCASDYPRYSEAVALKVANDPLVEPAARGILICKSGIGHSIVANKIPGAYAALCYNTEAAALSRQHNNANILILGADFVTPEQMYEIIRVWLASDFEGGRHQRRFDQIQGIEKKYFK